MTFYFLNINEEPIASLLLGHLQARDGTPLIVLYEMQEASSQKLQPYIEELLNKIDGVLHTPANATVMVYHRLKYSGVWYKYTPILEPQDAQSLDFMGFDGDLIRAAAKDTNGLSTVHVRIEGFAKDTSRTAIFEALEQLWIASSGEHDFKIRLAAWSSSSPSKDTA